MPQLKPIEIIPIRKKPQPSPKPPNAQAIEAALRAGPGFSFPWARLILSASLQGIDWLTVTGRSLGPDGARAFQDGMRMLGQMIDKGVIEAAEEAVRNASKQQRPPDSEPEPPRTPEPIRVVDLEARNAAELLGVAEGATQDDIRAALRRRLASSQLHPDQGGDGEEAKRLIAAKNLLIDRARRAVRP
jgi:hypothetical protein